MILDLMSGRNVAVEFLDRPDVEAVLDAQLEPLDSRPPKQSPSPQGCRS